MNISGKQRRKIRNWSVIFSVFLIVACGANQKEEKKATILQGTTQGTTYAVILPDGEAITKLEIDNLLKEFDEALSGYIPNSILSKLNACNGSISLQDPHGYFRECYELSQAIYEQTNGLFDPSVYPLVKGYGFITGESTPLADNEIDSLLDFVGFKHDSLHSISFASNAIEYTKKTQGFKLDFNAVAQGYSVDVLADYFESKGVKNYYIEIGGEVRVKGKNREGIAWKIGVDSPVQDKNERVITEVLHLTDKGIATSGNYRKFYVKDGKKYAHTFNPKTGRPVEHNMLSATVIAKTAGEADAYATAFMVMGMDEAKAFVENHPELNLDVLFISSDSDNKLSSFKSEGFKKYLSK